MQCIIGTNAFSEITWSRCILNLQFMNLYMILEYLLLCWIHCIKGRRRRIAIYHWEVSYLPSWSTSLMSSSSSAIVGFWPRDFITDASSPPEMFPEPSLSNRLNASRNSGRKKKWNLLLSIHKYSSNYSNKSINKILKTKQTIHRAYFQCTWS